MSDSSPPPTPGSLAHRLRRPIEVIIVSSVMFTFISYWRTAAVVLCDLASTAYYIGGIAESAIGPAAPWFILAVMLFSYAVRSIYIESCSLFVRGGVYRVVKEAMGGFLAKLSVSALMFDYVLTGPISGMSAGQYIMGLVLDSLATLNPHLALGPRRRRNRSSDGRRGDRLPHHALLLPAEHPRHSRIERKGAENHDRHDRHGGRDARMVRRHAGGAGAGQFRPARARSAAQGRIRRRRRGSIA